MPLRRNPDDRRDNWFGERPQRRGYYQDPSTPRAGDEAEYRPRRWERSFGFARQRDIGDERSQQAAPHGYGRYDRTGEERYARGLEEFDAEYQSRGRRPFDAVPSWDMGDAGMPSHDLGSVPGPHRGRGPRGYQRSDERIREDVCEFLTDAGDVDASEIEVQVTSGVVTLSGSVENRHAKRRAEDLAEAVSGVREVQNQLRLQPAAQGRAEEPDRTGR